MLRRLRERRRRETGSAGRGGRVGHVGPRRLRSLTPWPRCAGARPRPEGGAGGGCAAGAGERSAFHSPLQWGQQKKAGQAGPLGTSAERRRPECAVDCRRWATADCRARVGGPVSGPVRREVWPGPTQSPCLGVWGGEGAALTNISKDPDDGPHRSKADQHGAAPSVPPNRGGVGREVNGSHWFSSEDRAHVTAFCTEI